MFATKRELRKLRAQLYSGIGDQLAEWHFEIHGCLNALGKRLDTFDEWRLEINERLDAMARAQEMMSRQMEAMVRRQDEMSQQLTRIEKLLTK